MAPSRSEHDQLVDRICAVLTKNPALLGSLRAPTSAAPGNVCPACTGCGNCASKRPEAVRAVLAAAPGARLSTNLGVGAVPEDLAPLIDHTLLRPEASYGDIDKLCDEAAEHGFASVCVNPMHLRRSAEKLRGTGSVVCTVIGFPLGATPSQVKVLEARRAMRDGARELDMVIAVGALKSGDHRYVYDDIRQVAEAAREGRALLKVILETALLTDEEKVAASVLSKRARADFVKTSTGFSKGGATEHDIALMARAVCYQLGVKASGGVKSAQDAQRMIRAGATRIGASVGVQIAAEARGSQAADGAAAAGAY